MTEASAAQKLQQPVTGKDKKRIPSLNGLRALSIGMVLLGHFCFRSDPRILLPYPFSLLADSAFGVNIFFVISGFLITRLLLEEEAATGGISIKQFYFRRTLRIFPAYYFTLFVYFLLAAAGILHLTTESWLSSLFYVKNFFLTDWETAHFWSLSVEEQFYLFWPLVMLLVKGRRRVVIAVLVIITVMLFRLNTYVQIYKFDSYRQEESLFLRVDALMIGCLVAIYYRPLMAWIDNKAWLLYLLPLIFLLIAFLNSSFITKWNQHNGWHLGSILISLGIGRSVGIVSNLLIVVLMLLSIHFESGLWFRFLNSKAMEYIGKISYSLYLWQQLFFSYQIKAFNQMPYNLLFIVAAALCSFYLIERPFLRIRDRVSAGSAMLPEREISIITPDANR